MFDLHHLLLFFISALILNITPGADMLFVIAKSLDSGIRGGIVSSLGVAVGCLIHILLAVLGLSSLISRSNIAFETIKYLGVAYLIYLGLKLLVQKKERLNFTPEKSAGHRKLLVIFKQGIITNILNPKVILFFLAFLPQFVDKEYQNIVLQLFLLGFFFTISGTIVNIIVASIIGSISNKLKEYPKFLFLQEKLSGLLIIGIGIKLMTINHK